MRGRLIPSRLPIYPDYLRFNMSHMLFNASRVSLAVSALLLAQTALAQDFIKGGQDKFTFNIGGIVNQFDTSVTLNGATSVGTPVNMESNGLSNNTSSLELSGTWRVADRHRLDLFYYSADRSGSRQYDHDITVGGNVIPAGFNVSAEAKSKYFLADYRYSFYKTDALELGGVLGFYGSDLTFNISGTGVSGGMSKTLSTSASTTVPLPVLGVSADWYITPRWNVSSKLAGMSARVGDVDGSATVFGLGTDYMLTRNWGMGLSYMYSKLNVDVTKSDFNGHLDWNSSAFMLYATLKY